MIDLNQKAWLKPYIDINTKLRQKDLFKLMNNAVFGSTIGTVRKQIYQTHNDRKEKNYLVSEPSHHTTKFFTENL